MSISTLNSQLSLLAQLCERPDNSFTYELVELSRKQSIESSLAPHFAGTNWKTKEPYSIADCDLKTESLGNDVYVSLNSVLFGWLFGMPHSPPLAYVEEHVKVSIVKQLCDQISHIVGHSDIYEIHVRLPIWYESTWRDFAFFTTEKVWFLHLGVSD